MSLWLEAFVLTCALEQPIYLLFLRKRFENWWAPSLMTLFLNGLTHPLLWLYTIGLDPADNNLPFVLFAEGIVVLIEALALWLLLRRRMKSRPAASLAMIASLTANSASYLGGLALTACWR